MESGAPTFRPGGSSFPFDRNARIWVGKAHNKSTRSPCATRERDRSQPSCLSACPAAPRQVPIAAGSGWRVRTSGYPSATVVTPSRLKAVTGIDEAVGLFQELGYRGRPAPVDAASIGLGDHPVNRVLKSASGSSRGSAVFFTQMSERPRTLKAFGKRLLQNFHDRPLGVVGVTGPAGRWERFIVLRPTWVRGVLDAVRVAKLEVDTSSPTRHDAEVLSDLAWRGDDREAQDRIDRALDVEAVTRRFYLELA